MVSVDVTWRHVENWGENGIGAPQTRRLHCPVGSDSLLTREKLANPQLSKVITSCRTLVAACGYFSIENPDNSHAFITEAMKQLQQGIPSYSITFDQCTYGLTLLGEPRSVSVRKRSRLVTNLATLTELTAQCPGTCKNHRHVIAWDTYKHEGKWLHRAALAGIYPKKLCTVWAGLVAKGLAP